MAALCEMKLNLQLVKYQDPPIWVLSSPEAEIPLAFVDELEDEEGQEILRLLRRRWARPQRVLVRYEAQTHTVLSYLCEIVQRASERSYLCKPRPQDPNPGFPRFGTGNPPVWKIDGGEPLGAGHGERLARGGAEAVVQTAPPRRGVLPDPAGAPAGRAHQESEADAAAAPRRASPRSGPSASRASPPCGCRKRSTTRCT